jgi:exodeoxyribonuclease VII large subunit
LRAHIWKDDFNRINKNFERLLKEPLKDGIKVLMLAKVSFDAIYGLSLSVLDIDPGFTLGDLEKEKQETITKLQAGNIFDRNKKLVLPLVPQRIAIISVETSKGYADYLKIIESNAKGYKFFHLLFPSLLQGDHAVQSILIQLAKIKRVKQFFDAVIIVRGGGGDIGLSCYNNYELAKEIAMFPIPVLTGIGHATNETVAEMVAYSNAITPTKLAEFLLQKFQDFADPVLLAEKRIIDKAGRLLENTRASFASEIKLFMNVTEHNLLKSRNQIRFLSQGLMKDAQTILQRASQAIIQLKEVLSVRSQLMCKSNMMQIENLEKNIVNMSPANVLKRGYSITLINGRSVKSISQVKNGRNLEIQVADGSISATVNSTLKSKENE